MASKCTWVLIIQLLTLYLLSYLQLLGISTVPGLRNVCKKHFSMMNEEDGGESGNVLHSIFRIKEGKENSLIYNQDTEDKLLREDRNSSCSLTIKESFSFSCQSLDDWGLTHSIYAK